MKRRSALKNMSMAFAGLVSLPAWATGWTPDSIGPVSSFPVTEEDLLAEIVETIIPETDTPGAKSLKVHQFAMRMVQDCLGEAVKENVKRGLAQTDQMAFRTFRKSFQDCNASQRTVVLNNLKNSADPAARQFVELIKSLTIRGYLNSEYVMTNILDYNMAPGFYQGCVPLKA